MINEHTPLDQKTIEKLSFKAHYYYDERGRMLSHLISENLFLTPRDSGDWNLFLLTEAKPSNKNNLYLGIISTVGSLQSYYLEHAGIELSIPQEA